MRIGILGPLDVRDEDARPVEVSGPRLRALLIRLAVDAGRAVPADRLLSDLWNGTPPSGGGNALQALVSRLRGVAGRDLIEHGPGGYTLTVDPAAIDAVAFERGLTEARALADPAHRAAALRRALELWRGPALADVADEEFAAAPIARLEEGRLSAVEERADADLALGAAAELVPELTALAEAHPLRERLRGLLMRALYGAGRQADALQVFEETRKILADRLGVDPSADLTAVHMAVLRQEPGPSRPVRLTNLPAQLTSFVGREEESARARELLRSSRLVTLTGPGGAGKTRLAAEATARLVGETPDGVWFVPLAPVSDAGDVASAVLAAVGAPETMRATETWAPAVRPVERLTDVLTAKHTVLVLDNCEHLIDAVAELVDQLLAAAPGLRILATSREPLGITGESLCPVPSLPLPPPGAGPAEALGYASVQLFADRAAAVRPGFAVDAATTPQVVEICRALDGIPLAIELAAARLRSLTPAQVAGRLGDRFRLLTGGSRTALPRHRTLRAVVDWSWDLLDETERTVLRRLSVFAGGATPESAAAICGPMGADDVMDVVAALVEKSLVLADGPAEVRYRLLETVRVYAAERLAEAGETGRVRDAHAAYFTALAERAEPRLRRRDQLEWVDRLLAERDNHSAAFRHVIDTRDGVTGLRLVGGLAWFWFMRDMEIEAGGWAVAVREITGDEPPPGLEEAYAICVLTATLVAEKSAEGRASPTSLRVALEACMAVVPERPAHPALVLARAAAKLITGDIEAARQGMVPLAEHDDPWVRAAVTVIKGHLAMNEGRIDLAAADGQDAYDGFRELGDRWGMMTGLAALMEVAQARGDLTEALRLGEEAYGYASYRVSPDQGSVMRIHLARVRGERGDLDRARRELVLGIRDVERIGEMSDAALGNLWLSEFARREGELDAARPPLERALELVLPRRDRADFVNVTAMTYSKLGCLAEQEGDLDESARLHAEAFRAAAGSSPFGSPTLATLVEGLAAYAAARGEPDRAAELLGAAHTVHGYRDPLSFEVRRTEAAARDALGEDAFAVAYDRGRSATREEVLALKP